jgi:hypothetical protein
MKKIFYITVCLFAVAITGCQKTVIKQISNTAIGTRLKFFHAAAGVPGVDAFVNGVQITPTVSESVTDNLLPTSVVTGYYYKSVFPGSNYAVVQSGSLAIKIVASTPVPALISPQTVSPGTVISNNTISTTDTSTISVITAGLPGSAVNPLTSFVVKDVFPKAVAGMAYVRIANMIPNIAGPVSVTGTYTATGATAATTVTPITNIAYGAVSGFVAVNVNALSTTSYSFQALITSSSVKVGGAAAIAMTPGRYYTLVLYGLSADYVVPGKNITLKATARPTSPSTDPTIHAPEIYYNVAGLTYYTNK